MADGEQSKDGKRFEPALSPEALSDQLKPFLDKHSYAKISRVEVAGGELNQMSRPWDDHTLTLIFDDQTAEIVRVLNKTLLPPRLSALWHTETGDVEVIWTANPLPESWKEIVGRTFTVGYGKKRIRCEFGLSSPELLIIAEAVVPASSASATNFRNLQSFAQYAASKKRPPRREPKRTTGAPRPRGIDEPRSFWIRKFRGSEDSLIEFIRHLNFYLTYFDSRSPTVLIHDDYDPKFESRTRYTDGAFPSEIGSRNLDENLVTFWNAADAGNSMLRFILYYRVIEYAAFHYLDAETKLKLRKILANPSMCMNMDAAVAEVAAAFDTKKMDDVPRFETLLNNAVRPEKVWKEIEANRSAFEKPTKFEGGFVLDQIISKDEKFATFRTGGMTKFSVAIRKIRNVLSHGRDQNTSTAIMPVERNLKLLGPWVNAIAAAAGEVVIYESVA